MEKLIVHHIGSRSADDPGYVISRYVLLMMVKKSTRIYNTRGQPLYPAIAVMVCVNSPATNIRKTFVLKPEEFENRVFTLKTHQKFFRVHNTPEESENATITSFVVEEDSGREITLSS